MYIYKYLIHTQPTQQQCPPTHTSPPATRQSKLLVKVGRIKAQHHGSETPQGQVRFIERMA